MRYLVFIRKGFWFLLVLLTVEVSAQLTRLPYLQLLTPTSIEVRWNTSSIDTGSVSFGFSVDALINTVLEAEADTFHKVTLAGLAPGTKYYYSVDTFAASEEQYFTTAPPVGTKGQLRIWVIADFGQSRISDNAAREITMSRWRDYNNDSYIINYPNPFHLSTNISYCIVHTGNVKIEIYDFLGRKLCTLVNEVKEQGDYTVEWIAKDGEGENLPGGIYILQISTDYSDRISRLMQLQ